VGNVGLVHWASDFQLFFIKNAVLRRTGLFLSFLVLCSVVLFCVGGVLNHVTISANDGKMPYLEHGNYTPYDKRKYVRITKENIDTIRYLAFSDLFCFKFEWVDSVPDKLTPLVSFLFDDCKLPHRGVGCYGSVGDIFHWTGRVIVVISVPFIALILVGSFIVYLFQKKNHKLK